MVSHTISSHFPQQSAESLTRLVRLFYHDQLRSWPMLTEGVRALAMVQTKEIRLQGTVVTLQFNPKRIVSTGAKTDPVSIKERKCFLCVENLPADQRGVLFQEKFIVLCNPMPIFKEHFTISHIDHIPQSIEEQILTFLDLAKELSGSHSIFYNGPQCGASAPDHMHFQASPAGSIPVERESSDPQKKRKVRTISSVTVSVLDHYQRAVIVLEGTQLQEMELTFLRLSSAMRKIMKSAEEPKMNVICSHDNRVWKLILFPRTKHRPDAYFLEGEKKILISPAAVDIGGLIITPAEKDFLSVDAPMIATIFNEVTVSDDVVQTIIGSM